jgi:hypothetical protein
MMAFPRWIPIWFRVAAIYGLAVLLPQYFLAPPAGAEAIFYGFVGIASAFQLIFWIIAGDPRRYRALMPVAVVEKLVFGIPAIVLFALGKLAVIIFCFGIIDLVLGAGFFFAWWTTRRA